MWTKILASRIAQLALVAFISAALTGGYSYWQKSIVTADLNNTIETLKEQAGKKTESRKQYQREDKEAENVIEQAVKNEDVKTFVDYWNSTN